MMTRISLGGQRCGYGRGSNSAPGSACVPAGRHGRVSLSVVSRELRDAVSRRDRARHRTRASACRRRIDPNDCQRSRRRNSDTRFVSDLRQTTGSCLTSTDEPDTAHEARPQYWRTTHSQSIPEPRTWRSCRAQPGNQFLPSLAQADRPAQE